MLDNETETVTKFDARTIRKWMDDLRHVLPIIPSQDGFVLAKDERLALHFLLGKDPINEGIPGITAKEAFALAGLLENLPAMLEAIISQQRDFVMVRRALIKSLNQPNDKQRSEMVQLVEDTAYIEAGA